jgi:hypothetical protein
MHATMSSYIFGWTYGILLTSALYTIVISLHCIYIRNEGRRLD